MLTLQGYRIPKDHREAMLKKELTVRPFSIVKPQFQPKYKVWHEDSQWLYLPKHFGLERYGPVGTLAIKAAPIRTAK